jgi:polyhydroxyalkanoate synthesis regulator protein
MIKAGSEVKIVDNRSKEDLTSVTLAQIIFEEEKKKSRMPLTMLRDIIRHGGETISGFLQQQVGTVGQKMQNIREEAEGLRDRILRREQAEAAAAEGRHSPIDQAKDMVAQSQRVLEDWQKRIDDRVHHAIDDITSLPSLARDMAALEKRIAELEKKLQELEH